MTWSTDLVTSPALYPVAIDPRKDAVLFVRLGQEAYRTASFLDGRMFGPEGPNGDWKAWYDVRQASEGLPRRCHFIFHISHAGSTLLSRLLGNHPTLFSLREPALLRGLAEAQVALHGTAAGDPTGEFARRLELYLGLFSRTFEPGQTAVIKATSFVSEMAALLLRRVKDSRALLMYVPPATFLRALLDGAMSDITRYAEVRLLRLHRRLGQVRWDLKRLSPGECVAMSWLCEMLSLHAAALEFPGRVLWMDFDHFLGSPQAGLAAALQHFNAVSDGRQTETAAQLLAGPLMTQYSKAPGQSYDSGTRSQLLYQADQRFGTEIGKGVQWLRHVADLPIVRAMLEEVASRRGHAP